MDTEDNPIAQKRRQASLEQSDLSTMAAIGDTITALIARLPNTESERFQWMGREAKKNLEAVANWCHHMAKN
jgi:hypothetical protein